MEESTGCVVFDIGTSKIRVGISGDDDPFKIYNTPNGSVKNGVISNFEDIKKTLHTAIKDIRDSETSEDGNGDDPVPFSLLISEVANNPRSNREKTLEMSFESLKSSGVLLIPSVLLTAYSYGKQTGAVIELGHGAAQIATVVDTQLVGSKTVVETQVYTGEVLTRQLAERTKLSENVCNGIKETHLLVSEQPITAGSSNSEKVDYTLPDGKKVSIQKADLLAVGESLFHPNGIHNVLINAASKVEGKNGTALYRTILFGGGGSMINGLKNRFTNEVKKQSKQEYVTVFATPNRTNSTWNGGSMLGNTGAYEGLKVTKQEWSEHGSAIIDKKLKY